MLILAFSPIGVGKPAPAFLLHGFDNTQGSSFDESSERAGVLRNGVPLGELLAKGFGFVAVYQGDLR